MKKIRFGTPEEFVPTKFCKNLNPKDTQIKYDTSKISFSETGSGCMVQFPLAPDEEVYGLGLQFVTVNHKGRKLRLATYCGSTESGDSHAPVPFFVTNKGYGMYFDTARYAKFNCGCPVRRFREDDGRNAMYTELVELYAKERDKEETLMTVEIPCSKGIDIYIFEGDTITDIVSQYNMFSGGGCDMPDWGLGVMYRAYTKLNEEEIMAFADYFRDNDIPLDTIGLEPGWQTAAYSCSYVWNENRFPDRKRMIKYLKDKDFHVNLWEHAFVNSSSPIYKDIFDYSADYEVWEGLIPDFATEEAQKIFADYHKNSLVSDGVEGFKLDECDNDWWSFPDYARFPSGMDGEQYHQLFGTLYMQTILKALDGVPTLSQVRAAGALCSSYPFVIYSDLYNHKEYLRGVVNAGFSGILWSPEVRHAANKKEFLRRLQLNVFSAQCLINGWSTNVVPWIKYDCEKEAKELLRIRKSLFPMLRKAFDEYKLTGKPPIRALVSDYTDDVNTYNIDDEYIFCDNLIVAPITGDADKRKVYLPKGNWADYWTKKPACCGWFEVETENIPVFEKIL